MLRCPFHPAARTPGGKCEVCCFVVGYPVVACRSCGATSCPGCVLTLSERRALALGEGSPADATVCSIPDEMPARPSLNVIGAAR